MNHVTQQFNKTKMKKLFILLSQPTHFE